MDEEAWAYKKRGKAIVLAPMVCREQRELRGPAASPGMH